MELYCELYPRAFGDTKHVSKEHGPACCGSQRHFVRRPPLWKHAGDGIRPTQKMAPPPSIFSSRPLGNCSYPSIGSRRSTASRRQFFSVPIRDTQWRRSILIHAVVYPNIPCITHWVRTLRAIQGAYCNTTRTPKQGSTSVVSDVV